MKKILCAIFPLFVLVSLACQTLKSKTKPAATILMDSKYLATTKERILNQDPLLKPAYDKLLKEAESALGKGPYTVTAKEKLAPSGDPHDYASYSRYWWPDSSKIDGLPYIRRDGDTYPGSQSLKESDRKRIGALGMNTETLGLAYYFTGEEKYAKKAAELLRVWFLDNETRMNPNVRHAQCRPGHNNGSKSGVLDGRMMVRALEGSLLIQGSEALSDVEYIGLKDWANQYFEWLTTSDMALAEAASKNNHGSYYDAQAMYFALYANRPEAAKQIALRFTERRLLTQIKPDGSMPHEMARTRPLFYSMYNLQALFIVAHMSRQIKVDIWDKANKNSRLRAALDYVSPYGDPEKPWPYPTLKECDRMELYGILKMADQVYTDGNYLDIATKLPKKRVKTDRSNLAFPLMR